METFIHSFTFMAFHKNNVINIYNSLYTVNTDYFYKNTDCLQQATLGRDGGDYISFCTIL